MRSSEKSKRLESKAINAARRSVASGLLPRWILFDYWERPFGSNDERAHRCCMRRSEFSRIKRRLVTAGILRLVLEHPVKLYRVCPFEMSKAGLTMRMLFAAQKDLKRRRRRWP